MKKQNITLSSSEKISLISNLSTMLAAGISILESVESMLEDAKGNQKKVLLCLREDLMQGKHVHESFSTFPQIFDKVTINLIKAAEEAGNLEITLKDLKINIQKDVEFTDKVKFAMIYPILIVFVFIGVLTVILIVVVPKLATVFQRLNVELPLPTKIIFFLSDLLLKQTIYFIGGLLGGLTLLYFFYKYNKQLVVEIFASLPLISTLVREIDLTRFTRSIYLLLSSGVPIVTALELTKDVVINKETAKIIDRSRSMVLAGKRLSEGLRSTKGTIPTMVIKLVEVGEKSGSLDKSMQDIAEYLDYQVTNTLKTITAVIEPIMLIAVGLSVGAMMISIISPIYGLIGKVGTR